MKNYVFIMNYRFYQYLIILYIIWGYFALTVTNINIPFQHILVLPSIILPSLSFSTFFFGLF